jgi:hypothetical protein
MPFNRNLLPAPLDYFHARGLTLEGRGRWRTTRCEFHGGSRMRINIESGAFICMSMCGARGGDVLAYERATSGVGFIEAARTLGAWVDGPTDGRDRRKPAPFTANEALDVAVDEMTFAAVALTNFAEGGIAPTDADKKRMRLSAGRLSTIRDWIRA